MLPRRWASSWSHSSNACLAPPGRATTSISRRQQLIVGLALRGGWRPEPERPLDGDALRSRSIDVFLTRIARHEAAVVEIWDWFADVGAAMRALDGKIAGVQRDIRPEPWAIGGLWVVRGTRRNRQLVRELGDLFAARFRGSPRAWLAALGDPAAAMPAGSGFLWTDVRGTRLMEVRLAEAAMPTP